MSRFRISQTWRDLYNLGEISAISARWKISCRDLESKKHHGEIAAKKKLAQKKEEIEQAIATFENHLSEFNDDETRREEMWLDLETKKGELETIIGCRTKGAILRSKSQILSQFGKEAS